MKTILTLSLLILLSACKSDEPVLVSPENPNIAYIGRFDMSDPLKPAFMYSGCAIRAKFSGTSVEMIMKDDSLRTIFTIVLDDSVFVLAANEPDSTYLLASGLKDTIHTLNIIRRAEWHAGNNEFLGLRLDPGSKIFPAEVSDRVIEFIGNSYTCGYGNEGLSQTEDFRYETENNYLSYGAITARELGAEYVAICRSGIGIVQGYGGNRDFNMPAVFDEIIDGDSILWDYSKQVPDLVVINLITNDLSAPLDSAEFTTRYLEFLGRIRANYSATPILCLAGPASPGKQWQRVQNYIRAIVSEFAKTDSNIHYFAFTPFEMHGSDWHPNVSEHRKMADELIPFVGNLMKWQ